MFFSTGHDPNVAVLVSTFEILFQSQHIIWTQSLRYLDIDQVQNNIQHSRSIYAIENLADTMSKTLFSQLMIYYFLSYSSRVLLN